MSGRQRRTAAQMQRLRGLAYDVLAADHPQSVRHVFYRLTDPRLPETVAKSDAGYTTVQRLLVQMRSDGEIPYSWITDATRRGHFVETYRDPAEAIEATARYYRRSPWDGSDLHLECWCESRSIAGVIEQETQRYAVPLYPSGGFASLTLPYEAAQHMRGAADGRPLHVLYIGDYDAAGVLIDRKIEDELRTHLPHDATFTFERIAVTAEQIDLMSLPTKPTKDRRGGFEGGTVEAEAIPAGVMRQMLREAIERHIDPRVMDAISAAEASDRAALQFLARGMRESGHA